MYHLLIEQVSTVTIEFLQYRARVRIGLNRVSCRTDWFIYIPRCNKLEERIDLGSMETKFALLAVSTINRQLKHLGSHA
jgi:hypothetical protein